MRRRWIVWLLVLAFLALVFTHITEVERIAATLLQGKVQWVLAAAALQVLYYIVYASLYVSAFRTVGVSSRLGAVLPLVFTSMFVNVVAPTGGVTGAAVFVDDASRRGQSSARAAAGTLLVLVCDFAGFLLVLLFGLAYLLSHHDLKSYEVIAAGLLIVMVGALVAALVLAMSRVDLVRRLLLGLQSLVDRLGAAIRHRTFLEAGWAARVTSDLEQAGSAVRAHPSRLLATLAIALGAHGLDLLSLWMLFLAFRQEIGVGALVAGYTIGVLFWIVSLTPQGIGVVEGVMALVFVSLGIPAPQATVISLAFRALTFWIPLGIGAVTVQRLAHGPARSTGRSDEWKVHALALLVAVMGVVNVLSAVTPSLPSRVDLLRRVFPLVVRHGSHLAAGLAGFALLLLADGLWRRKRLAWALAIATLLVSAVSHLIKGLDYEEAGLALALTLLLLACRALFHARSDPPSVRHALATLLAAFGFTLLYGTAGFYLLDHHFRVTYALGPAVRETLILLTQFSDPGLEPTTIFSRYFADSIYLVGLVTTGYSLLMLLSPVFVRRPASAEARLRAAGIAEAYGRSSLARMTLFDDKAYYFSPGGSMVAFVEKGRAALALGDPIGPPDDVEATVRGFQQLCSGNDWVPVFYQVLPDHLDVYQRAGFARLCVGQEAIIDLAGFSLEGRERKDFRSTVNRFGRLGYQAEVQAPPIPAALLSELRQVSDEWLTLVHGTEKHFSLGWFNDDYIRNSLVMTISSSEKFVTAFANIVPEYRLNEASVDLMRHRRDAPAGTMDFLFVSLIEWTRTKGYDSFNLGLSSLAGVGEEPHDPALEKGLHFIYQHVNSFYNFKGLHSFKAKFNPRWSPRYLIYPGAASLPAILAGLTHADSGGGLLGGILRR
jgi:phosphatidylglycerol lysyltransferase